MSGVTYHGSVKSKILVSFLFCGAVLCALAQDAIKPTADGYVFSYTSKSSFSVNGMEVVTTPDTQYARRVKEGDGYTDTSDPSLADRLTLGTQVQVFGDRNSHHQIVAQQIFFKQPTPQNYIASGEAVIQEIISSKPNTVVEADGYKISIPATVNIQRQGQLAANAPPAENLWLNYTGKLGADGLVVANQATLKPFVFGFRSKDALRADGDKFLAPDYAANRAGKVNLGFGIVGSIPADKKLQQRLQTIGERLIPQCQKDMADSDLQKIHFHFYAFDNKRFRIPVASQDGSVFVTVQTVERMQNDDELAAVLADAMAQALEWQPMQKILQQSKDASMMMGMAGIPSLGPLTVITLDSVAISKAHGAKKGGQNMERQRARVALALLHDAGFDVYQAPVAWQLLLARNAKKALTEPLPPPSKYLWSVLVEEYPVSSGKADAPTERAASK